MRAGLAVGIGFPRLREAGNVQVGDRETGQAGLGLGAAAGRAFVADLAAGTGRRAGERRDRGRMIVRLDLHQGVRQFVAVTHSRRRRADRNARSRAPSITEELSE